MRLTEWERVGRHRGLVLAGALVACAALAAWLSIGSARLEQQAAIPGGIVGYEVAGTADRLLAYGARIIEAGLRSSLLAQLSVDYAFVLAYVLALRLAAGRAIGHALLPHALRTPLQFAVRWATIAGILDMAENSLLLAAQLTHSHAVLALCAGSATAAAVLKFIQIAAAIAVVTGTWLVVGARSLLRR